MVETADTSIDKFKRIRSLKCYNQVEEMLYAGYPPSGIANYIQVRMNEYRDVKRASLIDMLQRFRQSLKEGGLVRSTLPRVFSDAEKKFANKMKNLERLEDQYLAMQYRFDVLHAEERMTGQINPKVDKIDRRMEQIISKMHTIQMDLGLVGSRDLGTITVSAERVEFIKNKYGEKAAQAFADPVSRGRVLAALNAIKRAGSLRNRDGTPMQVGDHMDLSEDESRIVDIEYEATGGDDEHEESDEGGGPEEWEGGPPQHNLDDIREDLSKPDEDPMDERVEALDPDDDEEEKMPNTPIDPPTQCVEMEPVRRKPDQRFPPGPMKPSVRGNVKDRTTSKDRKKKDNQ